MHLRLLVLTPVVLLAACHSSAPASSPQPVDRVTTGEVIASMPVDVHAEDSVPVLISALPPEAAGIRIVPDTVVLGVGDTLNLRSLRVLVVDSRGETLGRLAFFNFGNTGPRGPGPQAARVIGFMQVVALGRGTETLNIEVPHFQWRGAGSAPRAAVRIVVR